MNSNFTLIARCGCENGNCPQIYSASDGSIVVQGYRLSAEERKCLPQALPPGEDVVFVPAELLKQLVRNMDVERPASGGSESLDGPRATPI